MSAYVVDREHIDALVRVAIYGPDVVSLRPWPGVWDDEKERRLDYEDADEIGRRLWAENVRSVAYRYPDDEDGERPGPLAFHDEDAEGYTYAAVTIPRRLTVPEAFKAIFGLEYQSCEHPGWNDSWARGFLRKLQNVLVPYVDGYEAADTWEVRPRVRFGYEEG